jgi:hypothetical protein
LGKSVVKTDFAAGLVSGWKAAAPVVGSQNSSCRFKSFPSHTIDLELLSGRSGFGTRLAFCDWRDGFKGQ